MTKRRPPMGAGDNATSVPCSQPPAISEPAKQAATVEKPAKIVYFDAPVVSIKKRRKQKPLSRTKRNRTT